MENPALAKRGNPELIWQTWRLPPSIRNVPPRSLSFKQFIWLAGAPWISAWPPLSRRFISGRRRMLERLLNRRANETERFERDGIGITMTVSYKPDGTSGEGFIDTVGKRQHGAGAMSPRGRAPTLYALAAGELECAGDDHAKAVTA